MYEGGRWSSPQGHPAAAPPRPQPHREVKAGIGTLEVQPPTSVSCSELSRPRPQQFSMPNTGRALDLPILTASSFSSHSF